MAEFDLFAQALKSVIGRGEVRDDFGFLIRHTRQTVKGMSGSPV